MKVGIVIGSVRDERLGEAAGAFVSEGAQQRDDAEFVIVDLKAFDLPVYSDAKLPMQLDKRYPDPRVQAWSDAIDACDAFIFVTPEYNHGVPGGLKNAVDSLGSEFAGKAIGFIGYGSVGGVRAIEQWRTIMLNFSMAVIRPELNLSIFTDFPDGVVATDDRRTAELSAFLDELVAVARRVAD